jgi:hypothetical protein
MRFGFDRHLVKSRIDTGYFPNSNNLFALCHEHHFGKLGSFVTFRRLSDLSRLWEGDAPPEPRPQSQVLEPLLPVIVQGHLGRESRAVPPVV